MYVCMYVCMYIYIYIYVYTHNVHTYIYSVEPKARTPHRGLTASGHRERGALRNVLLLSLSFVYIVISIIIIVIIIIIIISSSSSSSSSNSSGVIISSVTVTSIYHCSLSWGSAGGAWRPRPGPPAPGGPLTQVHACMYVHAD